MNASASRRAHAIESARLMGVPMGERHYADLRVLHGDLRVMATLSIDGAAMPEERSHHLLELSEHHWRKHRFGLWAFREKTSGEFAGYCGIKWTFVEETPVVELAYAFRPETWRRGFASEAAIAALEYGFETVGLDEIFAFTLVTNAQSRRVMEKCGFTYQRDFTHVGTPHALYRQSRAEFSRMRAPHRAH
jgi:RimJ/RimL family protein N-acetyltransferase